MWVRPTRLMLPHRIDRKDDRCEIPRVHPYLLQLADSDDTLHLVLHLVLNVTVCEHSQIPHASKRREHLRSVQNVRHLTAEVINDQHIPSL